MWLKFETHLRYKFSAIIYNSENNKNAQIFIHTSSILTRDGRFTGFPISVRFISLIADDLKFRFMNSSQSKISLVF